MLIVVMVMAITLVFAATGLLWCFRNHDAHNVMFKNLTKTREAFFAVDDKDDECAPADTKCKWRKAEERRKRVLGKLMEEEREKKKKQDEEEEEKQVVDKKISLAAAATSDSDARFYDAPLDLLEYKNDRKSERDHSKASTATAATAATDSKSEPDAAVTYCMNHRVVTYEGGAGEFTTTAKDAEALEKFIGKKGGDEFYVLGALSRTSIGNTKERRTHFSVINTRRPVFRIRATSTSTKSDADDRVTILLDPRDVVIPHTAYLSICKGERAAEEEEKEEKGVALDPSTMEREFDTMVNFRYDGVDAVDYHDKKGTDYDAAFGLTTTPESVRHNKSDVCLLGSVRTFEGGTNWVKMRAKDLRRVKELMRTHEADRLSIVNVESTTGNVIATEERTAEIAEFEKNGADALKKLRIVSTADEGGDIDDDERLITVRFEPPSGSESLLFPVSLLLDVCCKSNKK